MSANSTTRGERTPRPQVTMPRSSAPRESSPYPTNRYSFLTSIFLVLPVLIILQVIGIQLRPEQIEDIRSGQQKWLWEAQTIMPARGNIYDRLGHALTGNVTVYEVGIELRDVKNPQTIAETMNVVLGLDYAMVLGEASREPTPSMIYRVIANNVTQDKIDKLAIVIEQMDAIYDASQDENAPSLSGVVYSPHLARTYPEKTLAANILGFVGAENNGFFGVEGQFNDLLAGSSKTVRVPTDPNKVTNLPLIPDGASVILTIDRQVQRAMEDIVDEAIEDTGADSATIVVINPKTGELLAMATTPRLDPNEYWRYAEVFPKDVPFNRAISQAYEPGSVYKVLTMASALDSGTVSPETVFVDTGSIEVFGLTIYNWDLGAWGPQTMQGCMQHSLNVCLAWVATQLGKDRFYPYMQNFGIGRLTGVDLAGEVTGRLKSPGDGDWYPGDIGTNAFGQGVAVTPLQMAVAVSALANDGRMMAPRIVRSVANGGYQYNLEQKVLGMPIKPETARLITEMLARSLENEASDALVPGYRIAGKTGTAEIPTPFGYTTNETNASFVGWGPVDDPQFLVYVWLERPKNSPWGSIVAAPVFREAVKKLVLLIDLPPDDLRRQLNGWIDKR